MVLQGQRVAFWDFSDRRRPLVLHQLPLQGRSLPPMLPLTLAHHQL